MGGPAGKGVGGGVGVAVGGRVGLGGAAVSVGCKGECSGDCKGESSGKSKGAPAVGEVVGVGLPLAVGEAVDVELGNGGRVCGPGDGDAVPPPNDWPQAERNAASAVAPAPLRKRRLSIGNPVFVIPPF